MPFAPQIWTSPTDGLTDLELRIKAALPVSVRVPIPAIAGSSAALVTVTWPAAFPDANYTVAALVEDPSASSPYGAWVRRVASKSTTNAVLQVNSSAALLANQAVLHVLAVRD
jgi:hypothetical protein